MASQIPSRNDISYIIGNDIRKGSLIVANDQFVIKVVNYHRSEPGKHGAAKIRVVGLDIFSGKKRETIVSSKDRVATPECNKYYCDLLNIEDEGWISVIMPNGEQTSTRLRLAPAADLTNEIQRRFDNDETLLLEVMACYGREAVIGCKINTEA